jgi:hypothetical protein
MVMEIGIELRTEQLGVRVTNGQLLTAQVAQRLVSAGMTSLSLSGRPGGAERYLAR